MGAAFTYCDFGQPPRKDLMSKHRSEHTARRHFQHFRRIYGGPKQNGEIWRLWQEDQEGNILNDTNGVTQKNGA